MPWFAKLAELLGPLVWNRLKAIDYSGQSSGNAPCRVGVATQVNRFQHAFLETSGGEQTPQTCMKSVDYISSRNDFFLRLEELAFMCCSQGLAPETQ
jgi:hypothetical protein